MFSLGRLNGLPFGRLATLFEFNINVFIGNGTRAVTRIISHLDDTDRALINNCRGRGITWYNFMSDQFSGFHGIVIPGTLRDSIYVLEGLLEQQTGLRPTEIMTDTSGASDLVFGLFWLLGYQFSPRLADAGEARFWRVDQDANYGPLDELARNCMDTRRAEHHRDDMLRIAGSLKLGTIHASELIRSLLKSERPSSTFYSGGGGLLSTASDYFRFCQMLLNGGTFNFRGQLESLIYGALE